MKILLPFIGHNDDANSALIRLTEQLYICENPQCIGLITFDDYFPEFDCDTISFKDNVELSKISEVLEDAPYDTDSITYYAINSDYEHISTFLNEKE
jgi:hypothetical protein